MKIYLGKYIDYTGPYQIAEKILFWKDTDSKEVRNLGHWLKHGYIEAQKNEEDEEEIINFFEMIERENKKPTTKLNDFCEWIYSKLKRIEFIHIDKYDTWSMDYTLAKIIYPMLVQLQKTKHGSPYVDFEDVPDYLVPLDSQIDPVDKMDPYYHERWDYVLNTMIYAFNALAEDLNENDDYYEPESIKEGLRLFGKYYTHLWD